LTGRSSPFVAISYQIPEGRNFADQPEEIHGEIMDSFCRKKKKNASKNPVHNWREDN